MVDYDESIDYFDDGDLAEPDLLPVGARVIGKITRYSKEKMEAGKWQNYSDGTSAPVLRLDLRAVKNADGSSFASPNVNPFASNNFRMGKTDKGRFIFLTLASKLLGMKKEELKGQSVAAVADKIVGSYVTFTISHSQGTDTTFQNADKIAAATADQIALVA